MRRLLFISALFFSVGTVFAQEEDSHHNHVEKSTGAKHDGHEPESIHNIKELFSKGHIGGDVRYFFMNTYHINHDEYYYANAVGGRLNYHTAEFKGFHIGLAGLFVYDVGSSEYPEHDEELLSVYERELFDLTHPHNSNDLDRMEELFLQYRYKSSFIKYGKMDINTPLMNPRDTRMKPYVFRGFWGEFNQIDNLRLNAGWMDGASPRSSTHWFNFNEAIDLYERGVSTTGVPTNELPDYQCDGVGILGLTYNLNANLTGQAWWYHLDDVANNFWYQADLKQPMNDRLNLIAGGIYLHQSPLSNDREFNYYDATQRTDLFSGKLGVSSKQFELYASYTHVGKAGRFVFPLEFGRAKLYTLIPRIDQEGFGDMNTTVLAANFKPNWLDGFQAFAAVGRVNAPDYNNYKLNKYGIPSYNHFAFDAGYRFHHLFDGLDVHALYVYKDATTIHPEQAEAHHDVFFAYHNFSLIANIYF